MLRHLHDFFLPHDRNDFQPHLFRRTSVIVFAIVIIGCEAGYLAETKYVFPNTDFLAAVLPGVLTDLTNTDRTDNGLTPLTRNAQLDAAAQAAAQDMAAKGYFSHVAPDGTTPWQWLERAGYSFSYAGQNLAVDFTDSKDVEAAWLASPTHRANIMNPQYTEIGFGTATGVYEGQTATFVVEYFATPAAAAAPAPVVPKKSAPQRTVHPNVLGTETKQTVTQAPVAAPELSPETKSFLAMLTSPFSALEAVLTALLTLISIAYGIALLVRGKLPHPKLALGGAIILVLVSTALLAAAMLGGRTMLAQDSQMASVVAALP